MPRVLAAVVVFLAAAAILVLEIVAARLLAPYVGVTLETYTGIIGTVLAGIAFGSWYGGRLADRVDPRALLGPVLVVGGILAMAAVPIVEGLGEALRGGGPTAVVGLALVAFFAPAAVLSAVQPTVAKLQLQRLEQTGQVIGGLSALATAGALVGTFVTGFVLVARFPTRPIVLGVGLLLVLGGAALWVLLGRRARVATLTLLALAVIPAGAALAVEDGCDIASAYSCVRVVDDPGRDGGRTLLLDTARNSYVDVDDLTHLEFRYARAFSAAIDALAPSGPLRALHIGGGGFTMPRYLAATRPGSTSTVLELDPAVVEIGRRRLALRTGPDLRVRVGDARQTIDDEPRGRYDVVVGDAFSGLTVPWHLTTVEMVRAIRDRLTPEGLYLLNVIDLPPLRFGRAEAATLRDVFDHVALVATPLMARRLDGGNHVFVASAGRSTRRRCRRRSPARAARRSSSRVRRSRPGSTARRPSGTTSRPVDQLLTPYSG
jgi:spermidine synthase